MTNNDILELGGDVLPTANLNPTPKVAPVAYSPPNIDYRVRDLNGATEIYDKTTDETQAHRRILLDKLMTSMAQTALDTSDKADSEMLQAKLRLANECRSLLNDIDTAENKNLAAKIKMKDMENSQQGNADITSILSKIKLNVTHVSNSMQSNIESAVDKAFEASGCAPILDTEIDDTPNMLPTKEDDDPFV